MSGIVNIKHKREKKGFNPKVDNEEKKASSGSLARIIWYFTFILLLPFIIHLYNRNKLLRLQTQINELSSGIDIQLKKRRDTLVKLVDSVKKFTQYEKGIFTDVTKLRNLNINDKNHTQANKQTNDLFGRLLVVAENYPDIKSNKLVEELMEEASYIEREISASRRLYNSKVQKFNQSLFVWPINIQAVSMELVTMPYFEATAADIKDVKIEF